MGGIQMKFLNTLRNRLRKNLIKNQSGQGATEYILLLVVVVGLVMLFKGKIKSAMSDKMGELDQSMQSIKSE